VGNGKVIEGVQVLRGVLIRGGQEEGEIRRSPKGEGKDVPRNGR